MAAPLLFRSKLGNNLQKYGCHSTNLGHILGSVEKYPTYVENNYIISIRFLGLFTYVNVVNTSYVMATSLG